MPPKVVVPVSTTGNGKFVYPNGDIYNGDFIEENSIKFRDGQGVYICFSEELKDDESMHEDLKNQFVPTHNKHDIIKFEGKWARDVFSEGVLTFADFSTYSGQLEDTNFVSGGTYTFPDKVSYSGEFRNSQIHGVGSVNGADPAVFRNGVGPGLSIQ
ncbi:hypothetical protein SS50377_21191 [Spironucleus salmonicida]|uniref:Uncharacterized protein n=1 Tax=Spironucleus salmonicida TaxID=348837 RepID=V6LHE4_9EUKA|nr:hypothetical protein SS50377_21191 [Spironucleus salmonicida]|eukprot:EST43967.1 hypothetical protein SS50377_16274 [Spironucleus salmonicida]